VLIDTNYILSRFSLFLAHVTV